MNNNTIIKSFSVNATQNASPKNDNAHDKGINLIIGTLVAGGVVVTVSWLLCKYTSSIYEYLNNNYNSKNKSEGTKDNIYISFTERNRESGSQINKAAAAQPGEDAIDASMAAQPDEDTAGASIAAQFEEDLADPFTTVHFDKDAASISTAAQPDEDTAGASIAAQFEEDLADPFTTVHFDKDAAAQPDEAAVAVTADQEDADFLYVSFTEKDFFDFAQQ